VVVVVVPGAAVVLVVVVGDAVVVGAAVVVVVVDGAPQRNRPFGSPVPHCPEQQSMCAPQRLPISTQARASAVLPAIQVRPPATRPPIRLRRERDVTSSLVRASKRDPSTAKSSPIEDRQSQPTIPSTPSSVNNPAAGPAQCRPYYVKTVLYSALPCTPRSDPTPAPGNAQ
jgi:hypothetical protein